MIVYLNTMKSHTNKKTCIHIISKCKIRLPTSTQYTTLPPSCGRTGCDSLSYIPELNKLDLSVQTIEGLAYLEHSAPR